jgi:hypothetical protein
MNKNGMPCGCGCEGKPYVVYSDNPKMDTSGMAQRKVQSYRNGGAILPAARIDGGVFVRAAQAVGLPTTNASLNRIVNLVNQGMTPNQAAKKLAEVRQYKSGGYVYSDKNDPDTRIDMDDMDEERM